MAKDIEQELDAIFAHHKARVAQVRSTTAGQTAGVEDFEAGAADCLTNVVAPALRQMAHALNERGVAARVPSDAPSPRIDIPVSRHTRLGQGQGGYPYLRARADQQIQRIRFEQNAVDSHGANAVGDYAITEVNPNLVSTLVLDLVRKLYGPF
jgi:hypothetical protein